MEKSKGEGGGMEGWGMEGGYGGVGWKRAKGKGVVWRGGVWRGGVEESKGGMEGWGTFVPCERTRTFSRRMQKWGSCVASASMIKSASRL